MPPRDRDRLDFVHLELCTNALILNGIGAPPLKRQVFAAARWSRSLLAGVRPWSATTPPGRRGGPFGKGVPDLGRRPAGP